MRSVTTRDGRKRPDQEKKAGWDSQQKCVKTGVTKACEEEASEEEPGILECQVRVALKVLERANHQGRWSTDRMLKPQRLNLSKSKQEYVNKYGENSRAYRLVRFSVHPSLWGRKLEVHNYRTVAPVFHVGGVRLKVPPLRPLLHMEWEELLVPGDSEKKEAFRPDGQHSLVLGAARSLVHGKRWLL